MVSDISSNKLDLLKSHIPDFLKSDVWKTIVPFQGQVIERFQPLFRSPDAALLNAEDLTDFLSFKVNHHWSNLERQKGRLLSNFRNVQNAISQLVDSSTPLVERFNTALEAADGFGRATATAILHVSYPNEFGIWNGTSSAFLKKFDYMPAFAPSSTLGEQYEAVNNVLLSLSSKLEMDLWTLDAFLFYVLSLSQSAWIIALNRADLERCIELGCFGKNVPGDRIREVQKGDKIVCYVLKEMKIVALGEVTNGYYQDTSKKFLADGVFEHRFDFTAEYLGPKEYSVGPITSLISAVPDKGNFGLLVKSGFRKISMQDFDIFEAAAVGADAALVKNANSGRNYWWVNQSATFNHENLGGYIWAPQRAKNGSQLFHHLNVSLVKQNDVVFHYANQKIVAVGVATGDGGEGTIPPELNSGAWIQDGFTAKVSYHNLAKTDVVPKDAIPLTLRQKLAAEAQMPFKSSGDVNQGYLYALPAEFAQALIREFPQLTPPDYRSENNDSSSSPTVLAPSARHSDIVFEEFCRNIADIRVNREGGKPRLYKPGMFLSVLTAIDDGKFQKNEFNFEEASQQFFLELGKYGIAAGESQAAKGFFHLSTEPFWELQFVDENAPVQVSDLGKVKSGIRFAFFPERYWDVVSDPDHRKKLIDVTKEIWFESLTNSMQNDDFDIGSATVALISLIRQTGYVCEPWQIAAYITAARTKPFLILAGISGSGKSQLPKLIAHFTGGKSNIISVKPDWTDSADVLGYIQLDGNFLPGKLLKDIRSATEHPGTELAVIIDEMNLAKVEYYFAELLSHIEDVRSLQPSESGLITQELTGADAHWSRLRLPSNMVLVGTVNMDESSHGFSRKVLDRAFTLEFSDIDLKSWRELTPEKPKGVKWPMIAWQGRAKRLSELQDIEEAEVIEIDNFIAKLIEINQYLTPCQLQLGYRSRDEIVLFVLNAKDVKEAFKTAKGAEVDPFDLALQMKVLPRIAGGSASVMKLVRDLLGWTYNGQVCKDDEAASKLTKELPELQKRYPRTCERLALMWDRLQAEGYTSYWL